MKRIIVIAFLLLSGTLHSQDTLKWYAVNQFFNANTNITIPIRTENFDSIFAFQYGIKFDTTALILDSVSFYNILPGYDLEGFGFSWIPPHLIPKNTMSTLWTDAYGYSLPDRTEVYNLHFTTQQSGWLKDVLFPSEDILVFEAIDETMEEIEIIFEVIGEFSNQNITDASNLQEEFIQIYPNPFQDYLNVTVPCDGIIRVFDIDGKFEEIFYIYSGNNAIQLNGNSGMKIIRFVSSKSTFSKILLKND